MYPMSSSRLQITSDADPMLYVTVHSMFVRSVGLCVSRYDVEVWSVETLAVDPARTPVGRVILWHDGGIAYSSRDEHSGQVSEQVEGYAKKLVTDGNLDNKPE